MDTDELINAVLLAMDSFPHGSELWTHFNDQGRLIIRGPWRFASGVKWQAILEPYNATGYGLDKDIEGIGDTYTDALEDLLMAIKIAEEQNNK